MTKNEFEQKLHNYHMTFNELKNEVERCHAEALQMDAEMSAAVKKSPVWGGDIQRTTVELYVDMHREAKAFCGLHGFKLADFLRECMEYGFNHAKGILK